MLRLLERVISSGWLIRRRLAKHLHRLDILLQQPQSPVARSHHVPAPEVVPLVTCLQHAATLLKPDAVTPRSLQTVPSQAPAEDHPHHYDQLIMVSARVSTSERQLPISMVFLQTCSDARVLMTGAMTRCCARSWPRVNKNILTH